MKLSTFLILSRMNQETQVLLMHKKKELLNWQTFKVFDEVKYVGQPLLTTQWVLTEREIQPKPFIKACLVVRGSEENSKVYSGSPTLSKDSTPIFLLLLIQAMAL